MGLRAPKPSSFTSASISRDARRDLVRRQSVLLEPEGDVALHGQVREQRVALEHHVDRPPVRRHAGEVLAVKRHAPAVGRLEPRKHAQQRGLAAARRAEQREELALEYVEREVLDRGDGAEPLADGVEPHQRARRGIRPRREGGRLDSR